MNEQADLFRSCKESNTKPTYQAPALSFWQRMGLWMVGEIKDRPSNG